MKTLNEYNARLQRQAKPRALRIQKMKAAGKTWAEIGAKLGISRQRAQQIAATLG